LVVAPQLGEWVDGLVAVQAFVAQPPGRGPHLGGSSAHSRWTIAIRASSACRSQPAWVALTLSMMFRCAGWAASRSLTW